ncbi:hypothetical protein Q5I06_08665 [Helicobacter sp. faydin-H76]|uniref:Uncharacterized protein n=1 Tax=Helicobacter cappadocius TaxID=3063998 RepID=A0AA90STC2_9HELI|nr:hypothetical protein [Helicobacter sp. faydin-H76]MDP2539839.1 hypothetical protein [Helicobacter sp. faydin-H76]
MEMMSIITNIILTIGLIWIIIRVDRLEKRIEKLEEFLNKFIKNP